MRLNILIDKNGVIQNAGQNVFIDASPVDGDAGFSLLYNQVTIECVDAIKTTSSGQKVPDYTTVVTSGLSGTLSFAVKPSPYAPYSVPVTPGDIIDISSSCILQWTGVTYSLDITATGITGCEYINILLDRN